MKRTAAKAFTPMKCTAIVLPLRERKARKCGKPAPYTNASGEPRCVHHRPKVQA